MSRRAWVAFATLSVIWGIPYLFVRLAVRGGLPPLPLAFIRVALGSLLLLALARRAGTLAQLRGRWHWLAAYALAEVAVPFPLIAFGEQRISSSLTAIVIAAVPLIGALLALRFDHSERPGARRALGLAVGFGGVVALVGVDTGGHRALLGVVAVLLAAVGYAVGPMIVKLRLAGIDPRAAMGASLALAALLLAPGAALTLPARLPAAGALASTMVLGVICTATAFVIFAVLIREAGTGRATVITYVNPVIAVGLGVLVLGERPQAGAIAGLLLILAGSWLATGAALPPWRGLTTKIGQLDARAAGIGELDARAAGIGELDARAAGIGELDARAAGIGELDARAAGIGQLDAGAERFIENQPSTSTAAG